MVDTLHHVVAMMATEVMAVVMDMAEAMMVAAMATHPGITPDVRAHAHVLREEGGTTVPFLQEAEELLPNVKDPSRDPARAHTLQLWRRDNVTRRGSPLRHHQETNTTNTNNNKYKSATLKQHADSAPHLMLC
eukprot:GEZU01011800.1.p2 GENE.GEZU01011800.1~~GEZU01011800.1.p2  ORF type:complete len:133 (+),score=9.87 GEZU01011800.1:495-893(+)